jgi:predicted ABC-type ATPase
VAAEKIHARIPRTMQHIAKALPLADEVRLLDNSAYDNPFQQIAIVKQSVCCRHITPLPDWARQIMVNIPHRHT